MGRMPMTLDELNNWCSGLAEECVSQLEQIDPTWGPAQKEALKVQLQRRFFQYMTANSMPANPTTDSAPPPRQED
jgi:hypothetical protein